MSDHAHILLVDDDPDLLRLLTIRLKAGNYRVTAVGSAEAALARLAVELPALVITDVQLPGRDGLALFDEIRRQHAALPVILLTAHGTIPDAVDATARGAFAYLTKPFDGKLLMEKVAYAVNLSTVMPAAASSDESWRAELISRSAQMAELLAEAKLVAGSDTRPVDVRLLSATHRDLDVAMTEGQFREDLYYRLNVVTLTLPPLAERREDIALLANHFLQKLAAKYQKNLNGFAPDALTALVAAPWPGNVRQLVNVVEQVCALATAPLVPLSLVQRALRVPSLEALSYNEAKQRFERDYLIQLLRLTDGNVADAARLADRNRTEFYRLLQKYELTPALFRADGDPATKSPVFRAGSAGKARKKSGMNKLLTSLRGTTMQTSKLFNTLVAAIVLSGASITASHAADSAPKAQAPADTVVAANAAAAVPDETITSSAKAALSADAQAATLPVKVATQQGVVVLSGDVPSAEAGDRVVQIVASVSGVKEIKNELKVKAAG
eukprot:gene5432-6288_t